MAKKLYSKENYREPRPCDLCEEVYDWVSLITVKPGPNSKSIFHYKEYIHLCPECYIGLSNHDYLTEDLLTKNTFIRRDWNGSFNRRKQ